MSRNEDIRRLCPVCFLRVWRRFLAIGNHSERRSIGIDIQGRLGNGGEAGTVLEYYGGEIL
jgi:hypothetical protein